MAKKKNSIKKEKIIEVLQQIPEKDLRSFLEKIICGPVVKARFLKEFDAYFINKKSADEHKLSSADFYLSEQINVPEIILLYSVQ